MAVVLDNTPTLWSLGVLHLRTAGTHLGGVVVVEVVLAHR